MNARKAFSIIFVMINLLVVLIFIVSNVSTEILPSLLNDSDSSPSSSSGTHIEVSQTSKGKVFAVTNTGNEIFAEPSLSTNIKGIECVFIDRPPFPGETKNCKLSRKDPDAPTEINADELLSFHSKSLHSVEVPHDKILLQQPENTAGTDSKDKDTANETTSDTVSMNEIISGNTTIVSFPVNGNAWGYRGWGNCSSQTGDWSEVNEFCICKGYEGTLPRTEEPCYHDWEMDRNLWEFEESVEECIAVGEHRGPGLALTKVKCLDLLE